MDGGLLTTAAPEALEPIQVIHKLNELAEALSGVTNRLAECRNDLDPVERLHDEHVENFVAGLWDRHVDGELKKWPGEDVRVALARRDWDTASRGKYARLKQKERELIEKSARLRSAIDAYRSILSAQKEGIV